MKESSETPNIQYPTREDVMELQRKVENLSTGANVHKLATSVAVMGQIVKLAKIEGWDEEKLREYNDEKVKLYELLASVKIN